MLSDGLEIELSDSDAENTMLKGDYLRQVVGIVIGGVPTVLEVHFMCLFISLSRMLLQGSVVTNLFDPMKHEVHLRTVEGGIQLIGIINLVADIIPPGDHFGALLGLCPSFSICFLVYLSLLHEFRSQGIGFGHHLCAGSPQSENIFEGVKTIQGVLHVAQSCIIVRFVLSIHIEFQQCLCALNCAIELGTLSGASAL